MTISKIKLKMLLAASLEHLHNSLKTFEIIYSSKNPIVIQTKFPTLPLQVNKNTFSKLDVDTLFFIFFIQQVKL